MASGLRRCGQRRRDDAEMLVEPHANYRAEAPGEAARRQPQAFGAHQLLPRDEIDDDQDQADAADHAAQRAAHQTGAETRHGRGGQGRHADHAAGDACQIDPVAAEVMDEERRQEGGDEADDRHRRIGGADIGIGVGRGEFLVDRIGVQRQDGRGHRPGGGIQDI
jgi:hypothetical protein